MREGGKPNDKCPYSRRDPQGRQPCGNGGRDQSDASPGQRTPRPAGDPQKLREGPGTDSLPEPLEGASPASTLPLNFWIQNCRSVCVLSHPVCGTLLQQLQATLDEAVSARGLQGSLAWEGKPDFHPGAISLQVGMQEALLSMGWRRGMSPRPGPAAH